MSPEPRGCCTYKRLCARRSHHDCHPRPPRRSGRSLLPDTRAGKRNKRRLLAGHGGGAPHKRTAGLGRRQEAPLEPLGRLPPPLLGATREERAEPAAGLAASASIDLERLPDELCTARVRGANLGWATGRPLDRCRILPQDCHGLRPASEPSNRQGTDHRETTSPTAQEQEPFHEPLKHRPGRARSNLLKVLGRCPDSHRRNPSRGRHGGCSTRILL